MSLRDDYHFKEPDMVYEIATSEIKHNTDDKELIVRSFNDLEVGGTPFTIRAIRSGLLDYIGSTYALQNKNLFKSGCDAFLSKSLIFSKRHKAKASELLTDLCLAICIGEQDLILKLTDRIVAEEIDINERWPNAFIASTLGNLLSGNFNVASKHANGILEKCNEKKFPKFYCIYFGAWATAAQHLSQLQYIEFFDALPEIDRIYHAELNKNIDRYKNDLPCEIAGDKFWDNITSALLAVSNRLGVKKPVAMQDFPKRFWDIEWMKGI